MATPISYTGVYDSGAGGSALSAVPLYTSQPTPPAIKTPTISPAVITSAPATAQYTQSSDYLKKVSDLEAGIKATQAALDAAKAEQLAKSTATSTATTTAQKTTNALTSAAGVAPTQQTAPNLAFEQYKADTETQMRALDKVQSRMSAASSGLIDSIKRNYDSIIQEQMAANKAYEGGVNTAGLVSGRNQYAPEFQAGLMARVVASGVGEIEKLQNKRDQLIAEAKIAMEQGNYAHVVKKVALIRQNYEDEVQAAKDLATQTKYQAEAERQRLKDERETIDYSAEQLAPAVMNLLTGNEEEDAVTLQTIAEQNGIPVLNLYNSVTQYKNSIAKTGSTLIKEYSTAVELGYIDPSEISYSEYVASRSTKGKTTSAPKGKVFSIQEANSIGVPSLAGVSEDQIINASVDDYGRILTVPPTWFYELISQQMQMSPTFEFATEKWEEFTSKPDFQKTVYGKAPAGSSGGTSGLNLEVPAAIE